MTRSWLDVDVSRLEEQRGWLGTQQGWDPQMECPRCGGDGEVNGWPCWMCQPRPEPVEVLRDAA